MRSIRPYIFGTLLYVVVFSWLLLQLKYTGRASGGGLSASANHTSANTLKPGAQQQIQLDSRLPVQTFGQDSSFSDVNVKFGSRFDFVISPGTNSVQSGTGGVYRDNAASYIVGISPKGEHQTSIFHMGTRNPSQGDTYMPDERWTMGLDTSRWEGKASDGSGMHITVDFIDPFFGEPGCTLISDCASFVRDDTVPVLLVGVSLQNTSNKTLAGQFLFASNRRLSSVGTGVARRGGRVPAPPNACNQHITPGDTAVNVLSYATSSDVTGGTLFMAGNGSQWKCNTGVSDRAGLSWNYNLGAMQTRTAYMLIGGWNPNQHLFINTQLPSGCRYEGLYSAREWASENDVVDFAIDNLSKGDNLLARAQSMEDILIRNNVLTPMQRWVIADTLRSYKSDTWLVGRQDCAGSGYDAAVYEGAFGFLTTVDVMHDYGYFEINRVPWFFRSELSIVFKNATRDNFGTYFQHDQGGDVDSSAACTSIGAGIPTIRSTCYPSRFSGSPMPTEEDSNIALLTAYYISLTGDTSLLTDDNNANMKLIDGGMFHNQNVGDPTTGIAYNFQDTNTTFDDQQDCLHNNRPNAGNLYYQGLKEATAYRATAFLDSFVARDNNGSTWKSDAARIESAMAQEYRLHGFIPLAENNNAYDNCNGRTITLGDGLFYLHLIGQDSTMNPALLQDLAQQYPADLSADTLLSPKMIALESTRATSAPCLRAGCPRYEWFSKVLLSGIVADLVYTQHGCTSCKRLDMTDTVFHHNTALPQNFSDGLYDTGEDWIGHYYPRGLISWAFLNEAYF